MPVTLSLQLDCNLENTHDPEALWYQLALQDLPVLPADDDLKLEFVAEANLTGWCSFLPGEDSQTPVVYRGKVLVRHGDASALGINAGKTYICKVSKHSLDASSTGVDKGPRHREAEVYATHLSKLQGDFVPRFYGFYQSELLEILDTTVQCILLEDCGGCLDPDSNIWKPETKYHSIPRDASRRHTDAIALID